MRKNVPYDVDLEFARMLDQYENESRLRREFDKQWDEFTKRVDEGIDRTLKPEPKRQVIKPSQRRQTSTSVRSNVSTQNTSASMRVVKPKAEETKTEVVVTKPKAGAAKPKAGGTKTPIRPPKEPQRKIETLVDILKKQEPTPKWNPVMPDSSSRRSTEPKKVVTKPKGKVEKKDSTAVKPDTTRKVNASTKPVKKDTVVIKPKSEAKRKYNPNGMDIALRQTVYENKNKQADYSFKSTDDESWMSKEAEQLYKAGLKSNRLIRPVINKSSAISLDENEHVKLLKDPNLSIGDKLNYIKDGIALKFKQYTGIGDEDNTQSKMTSLNKPTVVERPKKPLKIKPINHYPNVVDSTKINETRNGDTITWNNGNNYALATSRNVRNETFGTRNRYDNKLIDNTEGMVISTFHPFTSKQQAVQEMNQGSSKYQHGWDEDTQFVGKDKNGKIKAGTIDQMSDDDLVSPVSHFKFDGFVRDLNGGLQQSGIDPNNTWATHPLCYAVDDKGNRHTKNFPAFIGLKGKNTAAFGRDDLSSGGHILVKTEYEDRIITGSMEQIVTELERMRANYKNKPLDIYILDGGRYLQGLRTKNRTITAKDQSRHDSRNNSGGNGMYIINK